MPTYRIKNRSGKVLEAAIQADSEFSACAAFDIDTVIVEEISPNPPASVFTIAFALETTQGTKLVEVCSTGSRQTALRELNREQASGNTNRIIIEESRDINQRNAKERRS